MCIYLMYAFIKENLEVNLRSDTFLTNELSGLTS